MPNLDPKADDSTFCAKLESLTKLFMPGPNFALISMSAGSGIAPCLLKRDIPEAATCANKLTPALKVLVFTCGFSNCKAPCLRIN